MFLVVCDVKFVEIFLYLMIGDCNKLNECIIFSLK